MWASFEMLDTFYGCMALLYHFVRDSLQLHNPYFISSQMKMTIVSKFCQFLRVFIPFSKNCLFVFVISTSITLKGVFFDKKRLMIFHKNDTQLSRIVTCLNIGNFEALLLRGRINDSNEKLGPFLFGMGPRAEIISSSLKTRY